MRKRMMISVGALTLALALAGCSPTQPAVDDREESKPNKTQQTSEGTSEEATKPEEKITEPASTPEESSENPGKDTSEKETEGTSEAPEETPSEKETSSGKEIVFPVAIDEVNFPDALFRTDVLGYDKNENGMLEEDEVKGVESIMVGKHDAQPSNIANLKGIEYFTDLKDLYCSNCQLTELDVSGLSKLRFLDCSFNGLTELNVSGLPELGELICAYNQLTELDVSGLTELGNLNCSYNQLTELNVNGLSELSILKCQHNELKSLNLEGVPVTTLNCGCNQLTELVAKNVQYLDCYKNQLNKLEVGGTIVNLNCYDNQLTSLEFDTLNVVDIICFMNPLTSVKVTYSPYFESIYHTISVDSGVEVIEEGTSKWQVSYIPSEKTVQTDPVTGAIQLPDDTYWFNRVSVGEPSDGDYWESIRCSWYSSCKLENGFLVLEGKLVGYQTEGTIRIPLADHVILGASGGDVVFELTEEEFNQGGGPCVGITIKNGVVIEAGYSA